MSHSASTLRKIIDDRVSLSSAFNIWGAARPDHNPGADDTDSRVGQVSLFSHRPYTVEQRFQMLKKMIAKGQVALAAGVSLETIRHEMGKPEHDGLAVSDLTNKLAQKKMLKPVVKLATSLKVKQPLLAFAV